MITEWKALYQQEPIAVIDCNDCKNISITEAEQRKIGNNNPHICLIYRKRCKHNIIKRDEMFIYPCEECCCDNFSNYNKRERLTEHRCSCGRLLGRFNGQAEVKCPKCRKMNVIGVEKHVDSGIAR